MQKIHLIFCLYLSCGLFLFLGEDFFPAVDAGQIRLHMRAPSGTRIEETARLTDQVEKAIREIIPPTELDTVLENIGVTISSINMSYNNAGTYGPVDCELLISLKEGHAPTQKHIHFLRSELSKRFPGVEFYFQPADIIAQILNFGSQAPIDIQFAGKDMQALISGESTQVPMLPIVNIGKARICRKLSLGTRSLVYEKN
jgi:multidrug efflux pump subunit AcrB